MSVESLEEWRKKLAERSTSQSPSMPNTVSGPAGQELTEEDFAAFMRVYIVLERARLQPFTTKSDFARMAANEIGICASEGMISTQVSEGKYSNVWMITVEGLEQMEAMNDVLSPRH